jgi:hypothetical protein
VQGIWQPLLAAARARGELSPELDERFAWEVLLGRDRTVNAFALPGGYLGLHLGLIGVVTTRDELASVLAHELSHVTQRHISRLITQQSRQTPLLLGAMVLAALAASKNPGAAQALMVGGQAVAMQNQLNFSRDMEREADRVGYGLMEPAGFAPQGFVGMFDKLQQANRSMTTALALFAQPPADHAAHGRHAVALPLRRRGAACGTQPGARHGGRAGARVVQPGVDALRLWIAEPQSTGFASQPAARRAAACCMPLRWASSQLRDAAAAHGLGPAGRGGAGRCRRPAPIAAAGGGDRAGRRRCPKRRWRLPQEAAQARAGAAHASPAARGPTGRGDGGPADLGGTHPHDAAAWQLLAAAGRRRASHCGPCAPRLNRTPRATTMRQR